MTSKGRRRPTQSSERSQGEQLMDFDEYQKQALTTALPTALDLDI